MLTVLEGPWHSFSNEDFQCCCSVLNSLIGNQVPTRISHSENSFATYFELLGADPPPETSAGVLIVAAARSSPPDPSLHFRLSILGIDDGMPVPVGYITPEEIHSLKGELPRLNTKSLVFVPFCGAEHGLVGLFNGEMETAPPDQIWGKNIKDCLPVGDFEPRLRAYIDSASNLLQELPLNQVRREEGRAEVGFAWPWGQGKRNSIRAGSLQRGGPLQILTNSISATGSAALLQDRFEYCDLAHVGTSSRRASYPLVVWIEFQRDKECAMSELETNKYLLQSASKTMEINHPLQGILLLEESRGLGFRSRANSGTCTIEFSEMVNDESLELKARKSFFDQYFASSHR